MKKIKTNTHLGYKRVRDVVVDTNRLYSETIGIDSEGNYILHKSYTTSNSSGYGEESEYFYLSPDEAKRYVSDYDRHSSKAPTDSKPISIGKNAKNYKKAKKRK